MATERYHGSALRSLVHDLLRPPALALRKAGRRLRQKPEDRVPPEVAALVKQAIRQADRKDWDAALAAVRKAADLVETGTSAGARWSVATELIRHGDCGRGLRLMAPDLVARGRGSVWSGEDLGGRTLVVRQRTRSDMGGVIRLARFAAAAQQRAKRCICVVEPRMMPLFQRSFPDVEVRPLKDRQGAEVAPGELLTSFEALAASCVTDWASVEAAFVPLKADPALVAEFRGRYRREPGQPLIGLSWGSRNSRKDSPALATWSKFIHAFPATFVSLQYGAVSGALAKLRGNDPDRLIDDPTVDQLKDMDRFAAQVASLDAVLTISNTGAHLAGALGIPTVLVVGDGFRGLYPLAGGPSGWYPHTVQIRRNGRDWTAVLQEATQRLQDTLKSGPS